MLRLSVRMALCSLIMKDALAAGFAWQLVPIIHVHSIGEKTGEWRKMHPRQTSAVNILLKPATQVKWVRLRNVISVLTWQEKENFRIALPLVQTVPYSS